MTRVIVNGRFTTDGVFQVIVAGGGVSGDGVLPTDFGIFDRASADIGNQHAN